MNPKLLNYYYTLIITSLLIIIVCISSFMCLQLYHLYKKSNCCIQN